MPLRYVKDSAPTTAVFLRSPIKICPGSVGVNLFLGDNACAREGWVIKDKIIIRFDHGCYARPSRGGVMEYQMISSYPDSPAEQQGKVSEFVGQDKMKPKVPGIN